MSMSSLRLDRLILEFPEEQRSLRLLQQQVERMRSAGGHREFTLERIQEITEASSQRILLSILGRLCDQGVLKESVRVYGEDGRAMGDFPSMADVPVRVVDWRTNREVAVDLDMLQMVYQVLPDVQCE